MSAPLEVAAQALSAAGLQGDWSLLHSRYESPGFETLCRIMAFQQLSGAHALRMCETVEAVHGGTFPSAHDLAHQTSVNAFLRAGVAPFRVRFITDLAASVRSGAVEIPQRPGSDVERQLRSIRGVGPWTADMYRMFALREMDIWPLGDVGLRKGLAIHGVAEGPVDGRQWQPFRSLATWFLWQKVPGFPLPGFRAAPNTPRQATFTSLGESAKWSSSLPSAWF